jgi:hypothetical protein
MIRDIKFTDNLRREGLPQFDESKIKSRSRAWYMKGAWYDGPLMGLLEYEGTHYWFDMVAKCLACEESPEQIEDCEHEDRHRLFIIQSLTPEELQEVESSWGLPEYHGPEKHLVPVGWFTDGCNQRFYAFILHQPGCNGRENCDCIIDKE